MRKTASIIIGEPDQALLVALNRFHYLTALQASRLLYPRLHDHGRYLLRRFKRLVDAGFVQRLQGLLVPKFGSPAHVFTLTWKGHTYVRVVGAQTKRWYRPGEETGKARNHPFMQHTLASIDCLLQVDMLTRDYPGVSCSRLYCERELKRKALKVEVMPPATAGAAGPRMVAVIPDGWFELQVGTGPLLSYALELDRGTVEQMAWRRKVAALVQWANGPYREAFDTDNLTIAVVAPSVNRREMLRRWTARELLLRGLAQNEENFLFTSSDPVSTAPRSFFLSPVWYQPGEEPPLALLEIPEHGRGEASAGYA